MFVVCLEQFAQGQKQRHQQGAVQHSQDPEDGQTSHDAHEDQQVVHLDVGADEPGLDQIVEHDGFDAAEHEEEEGGGDVTGQEQIKRRRDHHQADPHQGKEGQQTHDRAPKHRRRQADQPHGEARQDALQNRGDPIAEQDRPSHRVELLGDELLLCQRQRRQAVCPLLEPQSIHEQVEDRQHGDQKVQRGAEDVGQKRIDVGVREGRDAPSRAGDPRLNALRSQLHAEAFGPPADLVGNPAFAEQQGPHPVDRQRISRQVVGHGCFPRQADDQKTRRDPDGHHDETGHQGGRQPRSTSGPSQDPLVARVGQGHQQDRQDQVGEKGPKQQEHRRDGQKEQDQEHRWSQGGAAIRAGRFHLELGRCVGHGQTVARPRTCRNFGPVG